jgi:glyoxylase-like metal-dependent hydrolase (beta-lactamase superfamily II)
VADELHRDPLGEEGFVIDSPIFPDELEVLPAVLEQAGFPVSGLLATHRDWDHVLCRLPSPAPRSAWPRRPRRR